MEAKKYKSFRYTNNLTWEKARRGNTSAPGKPQMEIGSPPEFKGEPGVWCPEELLVAALNGCLMLTFISLAQSKGVSHAHACRGRPRLDYRVEPKTWMSALV